MQIEHFIQVVKTEVMTRSYKLVEEYEYTAHSSLVHSLHIPEAKFHYELSPMQVFINAFHDYVVDLYTFVILVSHPQYLSSAIRS